MWRRVAFVLGLLAGGGAALTTASASDAVVGLREVFPAKPEAAEVARNLQAMLEGNLVREFGRIDDEDRPGDAAVAVMDPKIRDQILKELELQKRPEFDTATRVSDDFAMVNTSVEGGVSVSDGVVSYIFEVVGPDGSTLATVEGTGDPSDTFGLSERLAKELAECICLHKPWLIQAKYNDLEFDEEICDVTEPFTLNGKGEAAGIEFRMAPISGGLTGSFAGGGTAGGVPWSGQGLYRVETDEDQRDGRMPIEGKWQITTPVGVFGDQGTIRAAMIPIADCSG